MRDLRPEVQTFLDRVQAFIDTAIRPNEATYAQQTEEGGRWCAYGSTGAKCATSSYFCRSALVSEQEDLPFLRPNPSPRREGGGREPSPPKSSARVQNVTFLHGFLIEHNEGLNLRPLNLGGCHLAGSVCSDHQDLPF